MERQRGGEKVFPTQLMTIRKSKKGTVRSVFLTEESSDYASQVISLFKKSIGKRKEDIENDIQELELKVQNPKIVKGLALLLFRMSKMEAPSFLDSIKVRHEIFSKVKTPPLSPETRNEILREIAKLFDTTIEEIQNAMYADKESEQILRSVPDIKPEELARLFNREQVETVMLKATELDIIPGDNYGRIVRTARKMGLLYKEEKDKIIISGPLSIDEKTERYGSSFSLLIRNMLKYGGWSAVAKIMLKERDKKKEYEYNLEPGFSDYLPTEEEKFPLPDFKIPNDPIIIDNNKIYPDAEILIENQKIYIITTRLRYYEEDYFLIRNGRENGFNIELFCILSNNQKCPHGAICFRDEIDWFRAKEYLQERYKKSKSDLKKNEFVSIKTMSEQLKDKVIAHLNHLYPDTEAMIDYLDFMGIEPVSILTEAGFSVKWKGLRLLISK